MQLKHWLFLSAALNVTAAIYFFRTPSSVPGPAPAVGAPTGPAAAQATRSAPTKPAMIVNGWVPALRQAGWTEERVGAIAAADFEARWQQRLADAQRRYNRGEMTEDALALFKLQHDAEQETELRAVLGEDGFARWDRESVLQNFDRQRFNLSAAEQDGLYSLSRELRQAQHDAEQARLEGKMDEGDADRQASQGQSQYEEKLKALLGDERYARLQSDNNPSAGELQRQLLALNVGPDETAAMLQAQQQWTAATAKLEEQFQQEQLTGPDYDRQVEALNAERDASFKKALGPEQYAEYQNDQDERYRTLKRYSDAWGLKGDDVKSLYGTIQSYESSMKNFQERARTAEAQGQSVDWPAVQATLAEYAHQTETTLKNSLGPSLLNKLVQQNVIGFDTE